MSDDKSCSAKSQTCLLKNKGFLFIISLILLFFLLILSLFLFMRFSFSAVKRVVKEELFTVETGEKLKSVSERLKKDGFIRSGKLFYIGARLPYIRKHFLGMNGECVLKSGTYKLRSSMNAGEVLRVLTSGKGEVMEISIPEGLTVRKISRILEAEGVCRAEDFMAASREKELLEKVHLKEGESLEGYLFPDTYFFSRDTDAKKVALSMVENFINRTKNIKGFTSLSEKEKHDAVILASIVEREYRLKEEAPLIAGVFLNRLRAKDGLYSCATIEYIITEIEGKEHPSLITYKDLQAESEYNTYKNKGLPPAPICNAGMVSLDAVVNAPETEYYYFRLSDGESGRHVFSKDFQNHVNAGIKIKTKKEKA